jgi:hypothetical protein
MAPFETKHCGLLLILKAYASPLAGLHITALCLDPLLKVLFQTPGQCGIFDDRLHAHIVTLPVGKKLQISSPKIFNGQFDHRVLIL